MKEEKSKERLFVEQLAEEGKIRKPYASDLIALEPHLGPESPKAITPETRRDRDVGFVVPGDASDLAKHMLHFMTWESYTKAPVEKLLERFVEYVEYCQMNDIKMSNQTCYLAMGLEAQTLRTWASGSSPTIEHTFMAKTILQFLSANRELQMVQGKLNPIVGIWWQKNYDGFTDQQELVISSRDPLENIRDVTEMEKKYLESVGVVDVPVSPPKPIDSSDGSD